jgi:hypothetical protein
MPSAWKKRIAAAAIGAFAAVAACWLAAAPAALAQDANGDPVTLAARKSALFRQMLGDPGNVTLTLEYAAVATRLGDYEAAITALERLLLFNPDLPRVDLELGVLYYRLGSPATARAYLDKASALKPPPDVQARIDQYQAKVADIDAPQKLIGYFTIGAQYQSDATVAPGSQVVQSPVVDQLFGLQFSRRLGVDAFASGGAVYSYDLGTQNHDAIEVTGLGLVDHYWDVKDLDLDFGEVTVGPRLRFPDLGVPFIQGASLKPYAIVNEVGLGGAQFFYTYGGGLEATATLWDDLGARIDYEFRDENFTNAASRPLSTGLTGDNNLVILALKKPIFWNSTLSGEFDYLDQSTRLSYFSNKTYAVAGAYTIRYKNPVGTSEWETQFFGSRLWSDYQAPDPCCNTSGSTVVFSGSSRYDRHWRYGVSQIFPVFKATSVVLQFQRDVISSNLPIYGYSSNTVLLGVEYRF